MSRDFQTRSIPPAELSNAGRSGRRVRIGEIVVNVDIQGSHVLYSCRSVFFFKNLFKPTHTFILKVMLIAKQIIFHI